ncbi:MAG: tetratricopeptide repeat protein [Promethearchaeota archaeon]|jgi:tetratricopeptide (TPR) repeat protein
MPEELAQAEQLIFIGKGKEALELITTFEKKNDLTREEQLSSLILKGRIGLYTEFVGEAAYKMSIELGRDYECVEALILQAFENLWNSRFDKAKDLITEAENLFNSLNDKPSLKISKLKAYLLDAESYIYLLTNDYAKGLKSATQCLRLWKKLGNKAGIISMQLLFGYTHMLLGQYDVALDYGFKCLNLSEELNFQMRIAGSFTLIAGVNLYGGNIEQSLKYCKKALSIKEISDRDRLMISILLGRIYQVKGELDRSIRHLKQAIPLAEEINNIDQLTMILSAIGDGYKIKNDYENAEKYLTRSLALSQKIGYIFEIGNHLFELFTLNYENNFYDKAKPYVEQLKELANQTQSKLNKQAYFLANALMLKASNRRRNRAEAEKLLYQVVEDKILYPTTFHYSIIALCDLLLEELSFYNNPEILEEINSLISRLLDYAEKQHSYRFLAEGKLLQAKVALIEMKMESAKKFMTEAQRIAEIRGLNLIAQNISSEHDILLEGEKDWENLKKEDAPMSERIKLASVDRVVGRLSKNREIQPPELVEEEPILLLIMDNSGSTYFNHPFIANWDHSDLFSSFMSAFNTFIDEIFSKSIDRIRVGENTILINPVETFLACYVIKGQSYLALQKLTRFTKAIRKNAEIWKALNKSVKTSEMLEPDKPSALKSVINEIFLS